MANLADTLEAYNGYCATGVDEEMFKEAQFLRAVDTGSLYVVELDIAAWVTLGGIKTDGYCRARGCRCQSHPWSVRGRRRRPIFGPFPTSRAARPRASAWAPGILPG